MSRVKDVRYYETHPIGRLTVKATLVQWKVTSAVRDGMPRWIANHLPRSVALWALVRIAAGTIAGDEHPDKHNYSTMYTRWQAGEGR